MRILVFYIFISLINLNTCLCPNRHRLINNSSNISCDTLFRYKNINYASYFKFEKYPTDSFTVNVLNKMLKKRKNILLIDSIFIKNRLNVWREEMNLEDTVYNYNEKMYLYNTDLLKKNNLDLYLSRNRHYSDSTFVCDLLSLNLPDSLVKVKGFLLLKNNKKMIIKTFDTREFSIIENLYIVESNDKGRFIVITLMAPLSVGSFASIREIIIFDLNNGVMIFDTKI